MNFTKFKKYKSILPSGCNTIEGNVFTSGISYSGACILLYGREKKFRKFSTMNLRYYPERNAPTESRWSESSSSRDPTSIANTANTNGAIDKFVSRKHKERYESVDKYQEKFGVCPREQDMDQTREELEKTVNENFNKEVYKIEAHYDVTKDKIERSKVMNQGGISRTNEDLELQKDYKLVEANVKKKEALEDIKEAYDGVMTRKFNSGYESSDALSSVASFDTESIASNTKPQDNELESNSKAKQAESVKQSPVDYVIEKQSCEMPDIPDSDGGGD